MYVYQPMSEEATRQQQQHNSSNSYSNTTSATTVIQSLACNNAADSCPKWFVFF